MFSKRKKKEQKEYKTPKIISFLKKKDTQKALGIFIICIFIYIAITFLSFLFTGKNDYSIVENLPFSKLTDVNQNISNVGGAFGAWFSNIFINHWFGIPSIFLCIWGFSLSIKILYNKKIQIGHLFFIFAYAMIWSSLFLGFTFKFLYEDTYLFWGGACGYYLSDIISKQIGWPGVILILISTILIFIIYMNNYSQRCSCYLHKIYNLKRKTIKDNDKNNYREDKEEKENNQYQEENTEFKKEDSIEKSNFNTKEINDTTSITPPFKHEEQKGYENNNEDFKNSSNIEPVKTVEKGTITKEPAAKEEDIEMTIQVGKGDEESLEESKLPDGKIEKVINNNKQDFREDYDPKLDLIHYKYPTIDLLKKYDNDIIVKNEEEQRNNMARIRQVLEQFKIKISSITATVGPTITLYEIIPQAGIRISSIKNLEDDIALSLSALGIRIIAPIPGKGTIGIEVPNKNPQIVSMRSLIDSKKFNTTKYDLPMAIGKTITNEVFMVDLAKMPHVLVAGATGQGKSVGLNAMITSLLYKKHPAELKFVLVDPKMVEFSIYSTIERHFLAKLPDEEKAIITDFKKVVLTLNSLTKEMDQRYTLLMNAHVRNIKEYNKKFINRRLNPEKGHKFLPYIVVIIDEFGDLIMTAGKEIELPIARIAQKARAVGIHMIIATQRPTTNIITGTIKANFPARVAFRVTSNTDSRTILDSTGANQLIGRGDLLFSSGTSVTRVQCAFVDTPEVENITNFIGEQQGYPEAFPLPEPSEDGDSRFDSGEISKVDRDPLFEDAARQIVIQQQGSTSYIQRRFAIGYNRAGKIIDQLEMYGIVGPSQGSKARQVLIEDEEQLNQLLKNIK